MMIYLDNAATSFPKPETVIAGMQDCMYRYCANPGRGGHSMSLESGRAVFEAREALSCLFNISDPTRLCFTKNATEALNIAIKGVLNEGDHVITTSMEHNSVLRPLKTVQRDMGIELSFMSSNEYGETFPDTLLKNIKPNTRLIISTISSNVNGIVMPVREFGKIAREKGILFLVDAAQGAGTLEIDVEEMYMDMMAFPGHKGLLGPQGTGGLYVREGISIRPIMQGGTGSSSEYVYQPNMMPDLLESGTLNTPGIIGLKHGIGFICSFGIQNIKVYKHLLVKKMHEELEECSGLKIYSRSDIDKNTGIFAFNIEGIDSSEVSYILDKEYGVASRAGLHCAPMAHETLGTVKSGLVRLSTGCFNTVDDIEKAIYAVKEILNNRR